MKTINRPSPWFFWGVGTLFYLYQFVVRVSPSVMGDEWMVWYAIDTAMLGTVSSLFYLTYSGMQVPLGVLLDKYGPRLLISAAAIIVAAGCLMTALSNSLIFLSIGRLLIGLGAACGFLGTMKIATLTFPNEKIGMISGLTTAIGTLGGIVGGAPLSILNDLISWQNSLLILALFGLVSALISWILLKKLKNPPLKKESGNEYRDMLKGLKLICKSGYAWRVSLFAFCMYVPISAFGDLWGIPFIRDTYQISEPRAGSYVAFIFFGVIAGGSLLGQMIKLLGDYWAMILGSLGLLLTISIAIFIPLTPSQLMISLFLSGFFFTPECIAFARIVSVLPDDRGGVAVGFTNMITMLSGIVMQPLIGFLIGNESKVLYENALWVIPASVFVAFLLALTLKSERNFSL